MTKTVQIGGLLFEVRRSNRRSTFGLTVDRLSWSPQRHVRTPASEESLSRWTQSRLLWVHRKLSAP